MDLKKFIENQGLDNFPIGLGGCRNLDYFFDSCDYDLMVFDENPSNNQIISFENDIITIHHSSLSETNTKKLLQYDKLKIVQDSQQKDFEIFPSHLPPEILGNNKKEDSIRT